VLAGPGFLMASMHTTQRESYVLRNREHDGVHGGATYCSAGPWHTQVWQGSRVPTPGTFARQMKMSTQLSRALRARVRILKRESSR